MNHTAENNCLKMAVFWVVASCSPVEVYQRFRGPCCLHHPALQPRRQSSSYSPPWEPQILLNNCLLTQVKQTLEIPRALVGTRRYQGFGETYFFHLQEPTSTSSPPWEPHISHMSWFSNLKGWIVIFLLSTAGTMSVLLCSKSCW
jgi:hypothetical protein